MTNCSVGQISVLRAESQSELRPYQRALAGILGRERFVITVDGKEYNSELHNLIGFGEVAPHAGLTVGQYLTSAGLIEGAVSGLLMAFGIEGIETKLCSALSPDEDRKVRIFAATADPDKALILNEPFEPISSNWRDRMAEFLTDFARAKNGLVVVASLSYRPESWIDNPVIARHQVGQSLRRTIGFGAAGSDSNQFINQIRDQIRSEDAQAASPPPMEQQTQRPQAAAMSLGAAAMMGSVDTETALEPDEYEDSPVESIGLQKPALFVALKAGAAIGAGGLGIWAALALLGIYQSKENLSPPIQHAAVVPQGHQQPPQGPNQAGSEQPNNAPSNDVAKLGTAPDKTKLAFILDRYPEAIRVSVLDTSRGVMGEASVGAPVEAPASVSQKANEQSGNFYKLLESASTDKAEAPSDGEAGGGWQQPETTGAWSQPESPETTEYNPGEEEERREAIRQKFLEAIRAAAERREQEGME